MKLNKKARRYWKQRLDGTYRTPVTIKGLEHRLPRKMKKRVSRLFRLFNFNFTTEENVKTAVYADILLKWADRKRKHEIL